MTEDHTPLEQPMKGENQTETPQPGGIETTTPPPVQEVPPPQVRVNFPDHPPVMMYSILVITVLVFLLQIGSEYLYNQDLVALFAEKINGLILLGQFWRLITPVLVHGGVLHIGFNMFALTVFGRNLERFYGPWKFLLLYLVSGFTGVVASFVLTEAASLGASTAIFGLLGAQGVFAYQNRKLFGRQAQRVLRNIVNIAIVNFLLGLTPGIDNWGHLGGLIGGLMVSWFGGPVYKISGTSTDLHLENQRDTREFFVAILGTGLVFGLIVLGELALYYLR
jgi:rhomboid protease GluP